MDNHLLKYTDYIKYLSFTFSSDQKDDKDLLRQLRVRVKMIYFDKENHDIEETNTETFMCRSMSATNAYTEL